MSTKGLHQVVIQNIVKGVPVLLCGSAGQMRAAEEAINKDTDNQALCRYPMALYVPADVPVYRRQQRSVLLLMSKPFTTMVCASAMVVFCSCCLLK